MRSPLRPFLDVPPLLRVWNVGYLLLAVLTGTFVPFIAMLAVVNGPGPTRGSSNALIIGIAAGEGVGVVQAAIFGSWMIAADIYASVKRRSGMPLRVYGILWRGLLLGAALTVLNFLVVAGACSLTECALD
ncbi:MAG: hypothetical protein QOE92_1900 [Chloroflexota bacterium]|jgi:hypothetical protein|nr:hypothetical protein [Chloroflexota bacterium]